MTAIVKVALTSTAAPSESVHDYFECTLRDAIVSDAFSPGHRLIEARLYAQLGVSQPSLSAALRQLEFERLLRITPHNKPLFGEINWEETQETSEVTFESCRNQLNTAVLTGHFSPINFLLTHSMSLSSRSIENSLEMSQIFLAIKEHNGEADNAESEFHMKPACKSAQTALAAHTLFLPRKSNLAAT